MGVREYLEMGYGKVKLLFHGDFTSNFKGNWIVVM